LDPTHLQKDRTAVASLAFAHAKYYDNGNAISTYLLLQPLSRVKKKLLPIFLYLGRFDLDGMPATKKNLDYVTAIYYCNAALNEYATRETRMCDKVLLRTTHREDLWP
jgi:hypothetical protein